MPNRRAVIFAAAALFASCATGSDAQPISRLEEASFVTFGGIEQWVTIRGDDSQNPVLLVVHGGPADTLSPYIEEFAPYEADFTVVQWDQRGAGRTYGRYKDATPDLTLDRVAQDGVELAEYLVEHLGTEKVLLLGHSWGSVVGVEMVKRRPDLFAAYVGTGQVSSAAMIRDEQVRFVAAIADVTGDEGLQAALDRLEVVNAADPEQVLANLDDLRAFNRTLRSHLNPSDAAWLGNLLVRAQEVSTPQEFEDAGAGMSFSGRALFEATLAEDLFTTAARLDVPAFVIQGRSDLFTPTAGAVAWFEALDAPKKELTIIEGAGHFALVTHQDDVVAALRAIAEAVVDE